jgi:hypothetical protein
VRDEPYTTPQTAATNICELVRWLSDHDDGRRLYRGQVRHYERPLLPSAYRAILRENPTVVVKQPNASHSMRGIGQRFLGNFVWDREDFRQQATARFEGTSSEGSNASPVPASTAGRDAEAYYQTHFTQPDGVYCPPPETPLEELARSSLSTVGFNSTVKQQSGRAAVSSILARRFPSADRNDRFAHDFVDDFHRNVFHSEILVNACGYLVGSLISQHYGFRSDLLDATTSIDVAAFFATHASPEYRVVSGTGAHNVGIIYRFQNDACSLDHSIVFETDYYHAPGTLVTHTLLGGLEAEISIEDSLRSLRQCFQMRVGPTGERRYDLLKFPRRAIASSRIGRQKAAVIIPDEIHKALPVISSDPRYGNLVVRPGENVLCQQSVEDLHYRSGVQCFYFRHTGIDPTPELDASYLWPNDDDYFLLAIAYLFESGVSFHAFPGFILPQRLDLVDAGHGHIPTNQLLATARHYMSSCNESALSATLAPLFSVTGKILYYIYKAGVLSYRGHVTGDAVAIDEALNHCRVARAFDKTSLALIALEMLLHETMGRTNEMAGLYIEAEKVLANESPEAFWEKYGCSDALEYFRAEYFFPLYQRQFSSDFSFFFYELYQGA